MTTDQCAKCGYSRENHDDPNEFVASVSSNLVLDGALTKLTDGRRSMLLYSEAVALRDHIDRQARYISALEDQLDSAGLQAAQRIAGARS